MGPDNDCSNHYRDSLLALTGVLIKYGKAFRAHTAEIYQRYALLQYKER